MSTIRKIILYLLYTVVLIAFIGAIIFALLGHSPFKSSAPTVKPLVSKDGNTPDRRPAPSKPSNQSNADTAAKVAKDAIAAASTAAVSANATPQLADTGPGDIAAVFAGSVLVSAWAYRQRQLRMLK